MNSHARVRARITGVFAFLLSQVSQCLHNPLKNNLIKGLLESPS